MKIDLGENLTKWLTILCCSIAVAPTAVGSYWGNLFIYFVSYIQKHFEVESELTAPWILPLWLVGVATVNFFAGQLAKRIGKKATLFCGIILQNFGIAMVYFLIGYSMVLINIIFGFIHGIGAGCVQITLTHFVVEWGGSKPGLSIALARGFTILGGIVVNHFVTSYINPNNLTPDTRVGSQRIFSQDAVVENVPSIFLVLGGVFFSIETLCLLVVREKPRMVAEATEESDVSFYHAVKSEEIRLLESGSIRNKTKQSSHDKQIDGLSNAKPDITSRQVIRRKEFYVFGLTISCACVSFLNTYNYYKAYGQVLIHDDLFLTSVTDIILGLKIFVILLWGLFVDKHGVKPVLVAYLTWIPLSNMLFYFSPMINKWIYPIGAACLVGVCSPLNTIYSMCVAKSFGKTHFSSNFGLVTLFCVAVYLVTPLVQQSILEHFGWFYMFFLPACLSTGALILVILVFPE